MATLWQYRLFIMIPAAALTVQRRRAIANRFAINGSGETEDNEFNGLANAVRLSATGIAPATAYALNTPAKATMKDDLRDLITAVAQARVVVLSADASTGSDEGVMLYTNVAALQGRVGTVYTWQEALTAAGLQVITAA